MQHQAHISDKDDVGAGSKLIAAVIALAIVAAVGGYVVFGSGTAAPPPAQARGL